jgi:histidinol-phosphatase (PHP family)
MQKMQGIIDYHIHSRFSADGQASIAELCAQAVHIGCREIMITDHLSFWPEDPNYYLNNFQEINGEIEQYQKAYQGKLIIGRGVEIDFQPETLSVMATYLAGQSYDYVLAGVHYVDKMFVLNPDFFCR